MGEALLGGPGCSAPESDSRSMETGEIRSEGRPRNVQICPVLDVKKEENRLRSVLERGDKESKRGLTTRLYAVSHWDGLPCQ